MSGNSYKNYRGSWSDRSERSYDYDAEYRRQERARAAAEREADERRRQKLLDEEADRKAREKKKAAEVEKARAAALEAKRKSVTKTAQQPRAKRDDRDLFDPDLVRSTVTQPSAKAKRVHVVLVDNSGSNKKIANHLKAASGYLMAALNAVDPTSQICFDYFSDHGDGPRRDQYVDFVSPDEDGDRILFSTLHEVYDADGGDAPEAIECAMAQVCDFDFGHIQKADLHLYLITDVVAHGMGMSGDQGCPKGQDWRDSLKKVHETFASFEVIGCGGDPYTGKLQAQFISDPARLPFDLIDLSGIESHSHRLGITGNALLFLVARRKSPQAVEMFLSGLYEKWLEEPIFGANTDMGAREAIGRFAKYIEGDREAVEAMMKRIIADD